MRKFGLLPRIILAIVLGVTVGSFAPEWFVKIFVTFNEIFGNFFRICNSINHYCIYCAWYRGNWGKGQGSFLV